MVRACAGTGFIHIKNKELSLREYEVNINSNITDESFKLLDVIIQDCFAEYTVLNIEYKEIDYINADLEKTITQDVAHKVIERVSPSLMAKLSLVYNTKNFTQLLSERVYLHTLDYSIKKNSVKEEK
jgi:hypothetical protein